MIHVAPFRVDNGHLFATQVATTEIFGKVSMNFIQDARNCYKVRIMYHIYIYTYVYMYTCIYIYIHICMYTYISYIYTHNIYIYIYTYYILFVILYYIYTYTHKRPLGITLYTHSFPGHLPIIFSNASHCRSCPYLGSVLGLSIVMGVFQNGWFIMEIPIWNGWWLGVPPFQETTISFKFTTARFDWVASGISHIGMGQNACTLSFHQQIDAIDLGNWMFVEI